MSNTLPTDENTGHFTPFPCLACGEGTRVIITQYTKGEPGVRRRRECSSCRKRATTFERWDGQEPKLTGAQKRRRFYIELDLRGERPSVIIR